MGARLARRAHPRSRRRRPCWPAFLSTPLPAPLCIAPGPATKAAAGVAVATMLLPPCRGDLFWLLERIMPRLHERGTGTKPVHILGIADPASIPQVCVGSLSGKARCWAGRKQGRLALGGAGRSAQRAVCPPLCCLVFGLCCISATPLPMPMPPQLVTYGCDTFDSCYPTRVGRHGTMLTKDGPLRVVS